jgi:hypothetical protein
MAFFFSPIFFYPSVPHRQIVTGSEIESVLEISKTTDKISDLKLKKIQHIIPIIITIPINEAVAQYINVNVGTSCVFP